MEKRFAQEWDRFNQEQHPLEYLLGDGTRRGHATDEQHELAATVVQWLGSPVGRAFLDDVGFVPKPED